MSLIDINLSALNVARKKMEVIAENISKSNVYGYKRKTVDVGIKNDFKSMFDQAQSYVYIKDIKEKEDDFILKYEPENPHADEKGFVKIPKSDPVTDMAELIETLRYYEINLASIEAIKSMNNSALNIGR